MISKRDKKTKTRSKRTIRKTRKVVGGGLFSRKSKKPISPKETDDTDDTVNKIIKNIDNMYEVKKKIIKLEDINNRIVDGFYFIKDSFTGFIIKMNEANIGSLSENDNKLLEDNAKDLKALYKYLDELEAEFVKNLSIILHTKNEKLIGLVKEAYNDEMQKLPVRIEKKIELDGKNILLKKAFSNIGYYEQEAVRLAN
jgi:hypothetical protein